MRKKSDILNGGNEIAFTNRCIFDFAFFCERVLGYTIKPFHKEWCELLRKHSRIQIFAPTGFGKTWIFGIGYPIWLSIFKPGSESVILSKVVKGQSSTIVEEIKFRIEDNEYLTEHLKPIGNDKTTWTKDKIVCSNNSKIYNVPYSMSIRGRHPDYIFGDEVSSYIDKSDHYQIWFRDVESRVDDAKHGKIAAVTTPIDPGDLGVLLYNNPKYVSKKYPAIVNFQNNDYTTGTSIWEERFSISKLMDIRERQGYANFERNYMVNSEADVEGSIFKTKYLFDLLDSTRTFTTKLTDDNSIVMIGADFALSDGPHADFDAYAVVEKCPNGKMVLLHLEKNHGTSIEDKLKRLYELGKMYNPYCFIVDKSNVGNDIAIKLIQAGYSAEAIPFGPSSRGLVLGTLKSAVENKLLIIPYSKECIEEQWLINELFEQMIGFKEDKTEKTRITTIISRSLHDDCAIALALAVKGAVEQDIGGGEKLLSA